MRRGTRMKVVEKEWMKERRKLNNEKIKCRKKSSRWQRWRKVENIF